MNRYAKILIGAATLTAASGLTVSEDVQAYTTLGFSLGVTQRDFRNVDNWNDAASNNNQTTHTNWPGYQGADMAVWKAGYEWGSTAFGNGNGDPTQGDIGSGGADFNPIWNGRATGSGTFTTNIIHAPNVNGGGAIAWTYPSPNGWLIEFADNDFQFADGPGTISGNQMDIQGVQTHEYGHALGLGHSNTGAATMYFSVGFGATGIRSIHSDDIAGVQAIYGTTSAGMPFIDDIQGSTVPGGTAILVGGNMAQDSSRVWMNSDVLNQGQSGGDPFKSGFITVSGGGTQGSFTVPSNNIETGIVHLKNSGGKESLGEGHPFDYEQGDVDKLTLTGPTSANTGTNVTYNMSGATTNITYQFYYSFSNAGTVFGGHVFDLGAPATVFGSGNTGGSGTGTASGTIPGGASGLTIYIEAITIGAGFYEDSNMITLNVN